MTRRWYWLLALLLCGCEAEPGSVRVTMNFAGTYKNGEKFAEGELTFSPSDPLFGPAVSGLQPSDKRRAEIPVPECPGSARFVEFGDADRGEGVEAQYRYRRDRGPLMIDLEIEKVCIPTYWVFMQGTIFEGRQEGACRRVESIDAAPEPVAASRSSAHRRPPGISLDQSLVKASYGYGRDSDYAIVEELLAAGADPNATDASGKSALALAAETGNRAIPRILFLRGARLAGSKFDGPWGAHQAAADGQIEILRSLLQAGAGNLNSADDCGMTPLLWTTRNEASPLFDCIPGFSRGYREVLVALLEAKADAGIRQRPSSDACRAGSFLSPGSSPLHYAAGACFKDAVQLLLAHGADPNAADDIGDTPLMAAAQAGCTELVALLLDRGAILETQDHHGGGSAIAHAVTRDSFVQDNVDTVALLLERGADSRKASEFIESWLKSTTGRGFGRKGLKSARQIARLLR